MANAIWSNVKAVLGARTQLDTVLHDLPICAKLNRRQIDEVERIVRSRTYRAGETIEIFLKGNKDFYGRVVYRDAEGNLVQLLPNEFRKEHHFKAGKTYTIPDEEDQFDLTVTPPFGTENIVVFASTEPLPEVAGNDFGAGLVLLDEVLGQVKRRMRGIGSKPGGAGNKGKREFHEATAVLKTSP